MSNLQVTVTDRPRTLINTRMPLSQFDLMFPFLIPEIHPDKASELLDLFDKYKSDEIPVHSFFPLMKDIVGMELIKSALPKFIEQQRNLLVYDPIPTPINSNKLEVPFEQLFNFLIPQLDLDKVIELQTLADKCERGEIHKYTFEPVMKAILGEQMLRSAVAKVQEQKSNLQVTVNEQPGTQINSRKLVVRLDQLYCFLIPQIDQQKAIELHALADKYERGEIPKHTFVLLMTDIVGKQVLRSALAKLQEHKSNPQVTVNEQPRTQIDSSKVVMICHQLYRFLIPSIDRDKAIELHTLAVKYERGEISSDNFVSLMKGVVGEQIYRSAATKLIEQYRSRKFSSGTSL